MENETSGWLNLPSLALSIRVLFSGYLLVVGLGILMSGAQILLTHGMADGKLGVSVDDVVYSYYGNRNNSKLEAKLNGSMKDKAPVEVRTEIIKWVQGGSPQDQWDPHIKPIFDQYCVKCHGGIPGLPILNTFEAVKQVAQVDEGATVDSLTRVSHIHLFGISFIFFFVGLIFSLAVGIPQWLKVSVIALPFVFIIVDILSWWLTKWFPGFAWFTIIGGFGYMSAFAFMWFVSMYQMWLLPLKGNVYSKNEWVD